MTRCLTLLALCAAFAFAGCTIRLGDFTMLSSKNIDLSRGADFERAKQRVRGEDTIHIILFVPTGQPNWKEATDRAIEQTPGAVALLDAVVEHYGWYIPLIYGQIGYVIEGTPLIDPAQR